MRIMTSLDLAIRSMNPTEEERILILEDIHLALPLVCAKFTYPYEASGNSDIISLFKDTYATVLGASPDRVFKVQDLPMVGNIGFHRLTKVTRIAADIVTVDALHKGHVEQHIGLGTN